jgi:glycosyltransferase involved in cell wall biosynthesis
MNKILNSKVSIVLPTYNGSMYIRQSIDSCLSQTYKNIELIIVDDGSSEDIEQIVRSYNDDRIFYFRHSRSLGLPDALNTGFSHTMGKYLTWTSDDNFYDTKAIEVMVKFLEENSKIDFVYTNYYAVDENGKILESIMVDSPKVLDRKDCIGPCFLYKRKIYEKIGGYDSNFILVEDYEYWLRVREQFRMQKLNEYLYFYRRHEESLSSQNKSALIEEQAAKASRKYIPLWARYYHQGWVCLYKKDYQRATKFFIKSLFSNPFHFIIWEVLFYSFLSIFSPSFAESLREFKNNIRDRFNKKKK